VMMTKTSFLDVEEWNALLVDQWPLFVVLSDESSFSLSILTVVGSVAMFFYLIPRFLPRVRTSIPFQLLKKKRKELPSACFLVANENSRLHDQIRKLWQGSLKQQSDADYIFVLVDEDNLAQDSVMLKNALEAEEAHKQIIVIQSRKHYSEKFDGIVQEACEIYYTRLAQGLMAEYGPRIRRIIIDSTLLEPSKSSSKIDLVFDEIEEFSRSSSRCLILDPEELERPKVYMLHAWLMFIAFALFVIFSSPYLSMMNPETNRPHEHFHPTLKTIAKLSNVPIKLGIFHGVLYFGEFFLDPQLFKRHIGQRFTTLWYQLFQHHRYGQHLQMHMETLIQLADALHSSKLSQRVVVQIAIWTAILIVLLQDAMTSVGWHSFEEQAIGFGIGALKLCFDLTARGARVNNLIGESLSRGIQWIGGAVSLGVAIFLNDFTPMHPTAMATIIFMGGVVTLMLLLVLKRKSLNFAFLVA